MHDIDRTQLETNMEYGEFQSGQFEFSGELQEVFSEGEFIVKPKQKRIGGAGLVRHRPNTGLKALLRLE